MKLFICGHARHGKDQAAEIIKEEFGLRFESSSYFAMRKFIRNQLALEGITYATEDECYEDRMNHRKFWFDSIAAYNAGDGARMSREIFTENDMYVGIRNDYELNAAKAEGLADLIIWIDASERVPTPESKHSNNITPDDCDLTITNNGTIDDLRHKIKRVLAGWFQPVSIGELLQLETEPVPVLDKDGNKVGEANVEFDFGFPVERNRDPEKPMEVEIDYVYEHNIDEVLGDCPDLRVFNPDSLERKQST